MTFNSLPVITHILHFVLPLISIMIHISDTAGMKFVFEAVRDPILQLNLRTYILIPGVICGQLSAKTSDQNLSTHYW